MTPQNIPGAPLARPPSSATPRRAQACGVCMGLEENEWRTHVAIALLTAGGLACASRRIWLTVMQGHCSTVFRAFIFLNIEFASKFDDFHKN